MAFNFQDFWRPELRGLVEQVYKRPAMAIEMLGPIIAEGRAIRDEAFCLRHKKKCKIRTARRHIAGLPCVGYSRKGTQLLCEDPSVIHALVWVALRLLCQEPDLTVENVKSFPPDFLQRFLNHLYHLDVLVVDAVQYGVPVARERKYLRFRHRVKVLSEISPVSNFNRRFLRACNFSWSQFWFMDQWKDGVIKDESVSNLRWASSRPTSNWASEGREIDEDDADPFCRSLTATECLNSICWTICFFHHASAASASESKMIHVLKVVQRFKVQDSPTAATAANHTVPSSRLKADCTLEI